MTFDGYTVVNIIVYGVGGIFALIGIFSVTGRRIKSDDDRTAANLITNLKTTVEMQSKTIETQRASTEKLQATLLQLSARNQMLEDLFQGRDPRMKVFLDSLPKLLDPKNHIGLGNCDTEKTVEKMPDEHRHGL